MKVQIIYTMNDNPDNQLEDLVNWPDVHSLEDVQQYVIAHLDAKYGVVTTHIVSVEAV